MTGADGKTTRIYTTKPVEKVVVSYTKIGALAEKTATQMDITDHTKYLQIGVSGDKIVIGTKVFDGCRRQSEHDRLRRIAGHLAG